MAKKKAKRSTTTATKTVAKAASIATETVTIQVQIPGVESANAIRLRDGVAALCRQYAPPDDLQINTAMRIGVPPPVPVHPSQPPAK